MGAAAAAAADRGPIGRPASGVSGSAGQGHAGALHCLFYCAAPAPCLSVVYSGKVIQDINMNDVLSVVYCGMVSIYR